MAVQSIWAPVQVGNVAGNHLLMPSREMAFGEVDRIRELNNLLQEIRPCAETLDDARDLLPSRPDSPEVISGRGGSSRFCVFYDFDFRGGLYWL